MGVVGALHHPPPSLLGTMGNFKPLHHITPADIANHLRVVVNINGLDGSEATLCHAHTCAIRPPFCQEESEGFDKLEPRLLFPALMLPSKPMLLLKSRANSPSRACSKYVPGFLLVWRQGSLLSEM